MGVRENKVEKYLRAQVQKLGSNCDTRKWVSPGRDGVPDQICFIFGDVWFVEVKTLDGKLSEAQEREHERLMGMGQNVVTVYGNDGVVQFIKEVKKNQDDHL